VQQALRGQAPLTAASARTLASGIDTAGDIALDSDDDLLFVDWWRGSIGELSDLDRLAPQRTDLIDYATASVSAVTLQFAPGARGAFEPYQPASGGTLWVHEISFGVHSQLRAVLPRRPQLQASAPSPIPAGPFDLITRAAPPMGIGVVVIGPAFGLHEWQLRLPGFEQPLWWSHGLLWPLALRIAAFDATGSMTQSLTNPGFGGHGVSCVAQVVALDPALPALGSTPPIRLQLGR
jgi:hypothetical protein